MIELKHVSKTYDSGANGGVDALKDVSLTIEDGDIYGIIGMSGAGKSKAASDLEDLGFYCVDNMPAEMIPQFAQLCLATKGRYEKVALVTDIRSQESFSELFAALGELRSMGAHYRILFVEASESAIVRRFSCASCMSRKRFSSACSR